MKEEHNYSEISERLKSKKTFQICIIVDGYDDENKKRFDKTKFSSELNKVAETKGFSFQSIEFTTDVHKRITQGEKIYPVFLFDIPENYSSYINQKKANFLKYLNQYPNLPMYAAYVNESQEPAYNHLQIYSELSFQSNFKGIYLINDLCVMMEQNRTKEGGIIVEPGTDAPEINILKVKRQRESSLRPQENQQVSNSDTENTQLSTKKKLVLAACVVVLTSVAIMIATATHGIGLIPFLMAINHIAALTPAITIAANTTFTLASGLGAIGLTYGLTYAASKLTSCCSGLFKPTLHDPLLQNLPLKEPSQLIEFIHANKTAEAIALIEGGTLDLNMTDSLGRTPLHYAEWCQNAVLCEYLMGTLNVVDDKKDNFNKGPRHYWNNPSDWERLPSEATTTLFNS